MVRRTFALALLAACGGGDQPKPDAAIDMHQTVVELPVVPNRNIDLLFMVDDSGSMADKQANLIANFPTLVNQLNMVPGGLPDLHLGVITTDMGTKASGSPTPALPVGQIGQGGCAETGKGGVMQINGAPVTGNFLTDIKQPDGSRTRNYTGELATVFGMMANVGVGGCGFEQPLASVRAALDNNPANAGFLRPDAMLAIVFLTDEDDCSIKDPALLENVDSPTLGTMQSFRCTRFGVTCGVGGATSDAMNQVGTKSQCVANATSQLMDDVQPYRDFLVGIHPDTAHLIVSGIMGDLSPFKVELRTINGMPQPALAHSCTYAPPTGPQNADPPSRLQSFFDLFPNRSSTSSICQQDLSGGLDAIGQLVTKAIGSPCVGALLADIDPVTPGAQVDCVVDDIVATIHTPIEPCDASETPVCWKLETDAATCTSFDHLKLTVVRGGIVPDPTTLTRMRCILQ